MVLRAMIIDGYAVNCPEVQKFYNENMTRSIGEMHTMCQYANNVICAHRVILPRVPRHKRIILSRNSMTRLIESGI